MRKVHMTSRDSSVSVEAAFCDAESITTPNYYEHDDNQGIALYIRVL